MTKLDILYLFFLIPPIILGIRQGIVGIVISLLTMIVFYILYLQVLGDIKSISFFNSDSWIKLLIPIILISAISLFLGHYLRKIVEKILSLVFLNWVNKLVGGALGFVVGAIICIVVCHFGKSLPKSSPLISEKVAIESRIHPYINSAASIIGW